MDQDDVARRFVTWRAAAVLWKTRLRVARERASAARHLLASVALVVSGCLGALVGGWLVGRWCLGLVLMAESGTAIWLGFARDDGEPLPRRGGRTVAEVLAEERLRP